MIRIFIVGMPRSGTTLLQSLLSCSPEALSFRESHLFSKIFSKRFGTFHPVVRAPRATAAQFLFDNGYDSRFAKGLPGGWGWPVNALTPNRVGTGLHLMLD